jgi:hypothetical protein
VPDARDATEVDLDGATGWIGRTTSNPHGPLLFLAWSPGPGVVFEITTDDMERTDQDLVELALATATLEVEDWDILYDD